MPTAHKTCSCLRCPGHNGYGCRQAVPRGTSRCADCRGAAERARGTARQRGYDRGHETHFRPGVLSRDPLCVCTDTSHGHGPRCLRPATVADHHPKSRRELVALGLDANDPCHGRGLCKDCHDKHTAHVQPGGWNVTQ